MKKFSYLAIALMILSVAAIIFINPIKAVSQKKTAQTVLSVPEKVTEALKQSCTTCHSEGGNGLAAGMWNLTSWDNYSAKKQAKKVSAMCRAISKGSMPPTNAKNVKALSAEQKEAICNWAASIQITK